MIFFSSVPLSDREKVVKLEGYQRSYCVYLSVRTRSLIGWWLAVTLETTGRTEFTNHSNKGHLMSARRVTEKHASHTSFLSGYCMSVIMRFSVRMHPNFKTELLVTVAT